MIDGSRSAGASPLLVRPRSEPFGEVISVTPNGRDWRYVGFRVLRMRAGTFESGDSGACETAIVIVSGSIDVTTSAATWQAVGRASPFSSPPAAVFLPPATPFRIRANDDAEIALCSAAAVQAYHPARLIAPAASEEYVRGQGNAARRIRNILMDDDAAAALFLTEVITPPGHWSSYPPHKHDEDNPPFESSLEEVYYYRMQPRGGFAFQRVYTSDGSLDETVTVHDGDAVLVPRGYHVCAAAEGYTVYYLNVLAGPKHVYRMTFDPAHAWIKEGWSW